MRVVEHTRNCRRDSNGKGSRAETAITARGNGAGSMNTILIVSIIAFLAFTFGFVAGIFAMALIQAGNMEPPAPPEEMERKA
jgi:hypothetical protein